jgi:hypothetical protein
MILDKAVNFNVMGIKCDNPDCDFADMTVPFEDYKNWVNKPCPQCGCNLLTQADYDNTMMLFNVVEQMNKIFPPAKPGELIATMHVHMDGSGKMDLDVDSIEPLKEDK